MAVIHDVHKLSATSAAMLHTFIDQVSPYPGSVFIFTMTTNEQPSETLTRKAQELLAEQILNNVWKNHLDLNHRSLLVARIASNAVVVWAEHNRQSMEPPIVPQKS